MAGYSKVGAFGIDIIAGSASFVEGLKTAQQHTEAWVKRTTGRMARVRRAADRIVDGFKAIGRAAKGAGRIVGIGMAAGVAAVAGLTAALVKTASALDAIAVGAERAGMGAEEFQVWKHAADEAGVSLSNFESGLVSFQRRAFEASEGNKTYAKAFEAVGITLEKNDPRLQNTGALLLEVADRWGTLGSQIERTGVAAQMFNVGAGAEMNLLMSMGGDAVRQYAVEMERLGLIVDEKTVAAAARAATEFSLLGTSIKTNLLATLGRFLPVATSISRALLEDVLPRIREFVDSTLGTDADIKSWVSSAVQGIATVVGSAAAAVLNLISVVVAGFEKMIAVAEALPGVSLDPTRQREADLRAERMRLTSRGGREAAGFTETGAAVRIHDIDAELDAILAAREQSAAEVIAQMADAVEERIKGYGEHVAAMIDAEAGGGTLVDVTPTGVPGAGTRARAASEDGRLGEIAVGVGRFGQDVLGRRSTAGIKLEDPTVAGEIGDAALRAIEARESAISSTIASAIYAGGRDGSKGMVASLFDALKNNFINQAADLLAGLFSGAGKGFGGGLGGLFGSLVGLQHGGSWVVAGPGGTDQVLQAFMATRGERITVEPSGSGSMATRGDVHIAMNVSQNIAPGYGQSPREAAEEISELAAAKTYERVRRGWR